MDTELSYLSKHLPQYSLNPNTGFVTGADSNSFGGLQVLFSSIKGKANFICYDIGLSNEQRDWCNANGLILKDAQCLPVPKHINCWQTYCKPWIVTDSPFDYTIWIDTDCVVVGDLSQAEFITSQQTFFTENWITPYKVQRNAEALYERFPTKQERIRINAGVFGVNKNHRYIIEEWKQLLEFCFNEDPGMLKSIATWDEGALEWAIEKTCSHSFVIPDYRYNAYTGVGKSDFEGITIKPTFFISGSLYPLLLFKQLLKFTDTVFVAHFATCLKQDKKYWKIWPKR